MVVKGETQWEMAAQGWHTFIIQVCVESITLDALISFIAISPINSSCQINKYIAYIITNERSSQSFNVKVYKSMKHMKIVYR